MTWQGVHKTLQNIEHKIKNWSAGCCSDAQAFWGKSLFFVEVTSWQKNDLEFLGDWCIFVFFLIIAQNIIFTRPHSAKTRGGF